MRVLLSVASLCATVIAQAVTPFALDGGLDGCTVDGTEYNSGGRISVNGWDVTVPSNLQVQFPAAFIGWKDFCAGGFNGHEVSVTGNVVDGKPIAGLVQISQFLLEGGSGVVESINGAAGSMKIAGGPTIKINDPNGVYGVAYKGLSTYYTADDENPSITAFSGFPMCIPRDSGDTKCPSSNRPAGQRTFQAPDALTMAPFVVGDYLEYSGVKVGGDIICYAIVAPNVQITTSGAPTYIRVEDAIIGVMDGSANAEFGDTRFIGYTSDPTASVTVYAIDVDPCTGAETERTVGTAPYKAGDARNKWIFRADSTSVVKYAKEYKIRVSTGAKLTNNGITAGQYVQPVTEWIFPEANVPGITPPVNNFATFGHLAQGFGRDESGNLWGQLNPWPGASAPAATSCAAAPATTAAPSTVPTTAPADPSAPASSAPASTPSAPTATPSVSAGTGLTVRPGILSGVSGSVSNSADFPTNDLTYTWSQVGPGPVIKLSATTVLAPSFTVPASTAKATAILNLKVASTAAGTSSSANITVTIDPSIKDTVAITSYTHTSSQGGTISVTAETNIIDGSATMKLYLQNTVGGTAITMVSEGGGKFSYGARSVKKPATGISVQSSVGTIVGGSASRTATTARRRRRGLQGFSGLPL